MAMTTRTANSEQRKRNNTTQLVIVIIWQIRSPVSPIMLPTIASQIMTSY